MPAQLLLGLYIFAQDVARDQNDSYNIIQKVEGRIREKAMTQMRREVKARAERHLDPNLQLALRGSDRTGSGDVHLNLKVVLRNKRDEMVSATRSKGGVGQKGPHLINKGDSHAVLLLKLESHRDRSNVLAIEPKLDDELGDKLLAREVG